MMIPGLFRAVAFDLDDTLLRDDLTISESTIRLLRSLAGKGIHIIPASGRAKLSMKPFVDQMECASVYISCNGAECWDGKTHDLICSESFSADICREIARFGKKHQCYTQTYAGAFFYYNEDSVWARRYAASSMLKGKCVGDLESYIQEPRNKILMMNTPEKIASMLPEAVSLFDGKASVTSSKPEYLEFNPPEATKGKALIRMADRLGISPRQIIAFGDSLNDYSMFEAAGWSVLVENGRESLKPLCSAVCGSNNQDGVAHYLADFFREVMD